MFVIQALVGHSKGIGVQAILDNATAVAYIIHEGWTRSEVLTLLIKELVDWCEKHEVAVEAVHILGKLNIENHELVRMPATGDWIYGHSGLLPEFGRQI